MASRDPIDESAPKQAGPNSSGSQTSPIALIDTQTPLDEFSKLISASPWVAIDTEADSLRSYPDKLCLIQVSIPEGDFLIDPLAGVEMGSLLDAFRNRELLFHGADYDLRLLRRTYGFMPSRVFDTMLAARLIGLTEFGLAALVQRYFNVQLTKSAQKADWRQRPLPKLMLEYATKDSHYLHALSNLLREQLEAKGRLAWHEQLCARSVADAATDAPVDVDECWRIKGSHKLSPKAQAVLRELWHWREREALEASKPPFFILAHDMLVGLAANAAARGVDAVAFPHFLRERRRAAAHAAIVEGLALPEDKWPGQLRPRGRRLSWSEGERMERLRVHRDAVAAKLELDPSLVATRSDLAGLAVDWAQQAKEMMPWQVELMRSEKLR